MTTSLSDIEIENRWNQLELEERCRVMRQAGFTDPNNRETPYLNWVGLRNQEKTRLRRVIIDGNPLWDNHAAVKEVESPPEQKSVKIDRRGGDQKFRAAKLRNPNICQRCEILFGMDGPDTLEFARTGKCERCVKEEYTGRMQNDWHGGEVVSRSRAPDYAWTNDGHWKPRKLTGGYPRRTSKWG